MDKTVNDFFVYYHSGEKNKNITIKDDYEKIAEGEVKYLASSALELKLKEKILNDGTKEFYPCMFKQRLKNFKGWQLRFRIGEQWYWYLEKNSFCLRGNEKRTLKIRLFKPEEKIPKIPFENITSIVLEAIWTESLINYKKVEKKYNILLLTNRDSDNVGDQVIEASDISLISTVMKNLNISPLAYNINSRAASIVPKEYISTKDENLLKTAEKEISKCDMIIFGGAPMFNYLYQIFYERTAITLELAKKYNKPVIFSAIGVERYDENNAKCQRLKETLNFDCVKQITTRDGINELTKYKTNPNMIIDRVADPAVFSAQAFKKLLTSKKNTDKKTVGIFIFRANGFKDNKIDFSKEQAAKLWKDLIEELQNKGYNYKLLTSGHFGDEAFLDYLIRKHGISEKDCIFNINFPELLLNQISSFDAVVSCRLHPSIISYSLNVPSIGIIWNPKVKYFYDCIGYENRCIDVNNIDVKEIVEKIELSIAEGITKDPEYLFSVYRYLFSGIQHALNLNNDKIDLFTYEELIHNIQPFAGTSDEEKELKLKRKFRRTYETLNKRTVRIEKFKKKINYKKDTSNEKKIWKNVKRFLFN